MDHYRIYISTIQVDPFAPPSSVRVRVPQTLAQFPRDTRLPDGIPYDVFHTTRVHSELLQDLVTVGKAIERVFGKKEVVEEKIL
ncbi:2208_t:CDS:2 [Entrophospora sp. SA101]|nr:2208_t:CDS:2 [Entrophospora sp. SA101]